MTLEDFGVDCPEPDATAASGSGAYDTSGSGDRCIALTKDRKRCSMSAARGHPVCHAHIPDADESLEDILTIYSDPRHLIRTDGWSSATCRAKLATRDERCTSSARTFGIVCATHQPVEEADLVTPDPDELQFEWIESALQYLDANESPHVGNTLPDGLRADEASSTQI